MVFDPGHIDDFLYSFDTVKEQIRAFPGCLFLELYRDKKDPSIFFTYSRWESEDALEAYRNSDLFKQVWSKTKPLFKEKAQAWSVDTLHHLN